MDKYDLSDVTFIIPLRIDSEARLDNINTVLKFLTKYLDTHFILFEADSTQKASALANYSGVNYYFFEDNNLYFHHSHYRNEMIKLSQTSVVSIWDADIISPIDQILEAVNVIRQKKAILSYPYDGNCYNLPEKASLKFKDTLDIFFLKNIKSKIPQLYGLLANGGALFVNKRIYMKLGMENEHIIGWGPEDSERLKRITILDYPVYRVSGAIYHLFHPRLNTSRPISEEIQRKNLKEFLKICSFSEKELITEIESWKWVKEKIVPL